jgi:ATP-dependent helicase/nuclease subunit A
MNRQRSISPATRDSQSQASRPDASAWVSANAGSGKTHVLTQRVIRLLLDGVPASRILCLTFTKAAAANMSMRVFDTLAKWTSLDDAELERAILASGSTFHPGMLATARKLFSRTIETPDGLKIQTIHGFCESILHVFPFEANVPSGFQVIDEDQRTEMLQSAKSEIFSEAALDPDLGDALNALANGVSLDEFDSLVAESLSRSGVIAEMARAMDSWPAGYFALYAKVLGLEAGESRQTVRRDILDRGFPVSTLREIAHVLDGGGTNDGKLASKLRAIASLSDDERLEPYIDIFFKGLGERRGAGATKLISKVVQKIDPGLLERFEAEGDRLEPLIERLKAADALERGQTLMAVVDRVLRRYSNLKRQSTLLDFDDLIERALTLLSRSDAQWVLYKLDSGIDHILVDEAQDTSRQQWKILEALAGEFTSGRGRSTANRTFFAVGDEKQSIFSFQGAEPSLFDDARRSFTAKSVAAGRVFIDVKLNLSFRSAPGILSAVDGVFADIDNRRGLSSDDVPTAHFAWKADLPSHVEIWGPLGAIARDEEPDWRLPLDAVDRSDPNVILADRIAGLVSRLLLPGGDEFVRDDAVGGERPIAAGDIMILMRRRGVLFEALIRALKHKGLPVAGADRMTLKDHIAIMDLIALGHFCLLPEDDLALACVLKSPLIGLDDDDLLDVAPNRQASLWRAFEESESEAHVAAVIKMRRWRELSRSLAPFFFYSSILEGEGERAIFLSRLGPEAGDAIDEFLRLALAREASEPPSLVGFLQYVETSEAEVKRDMEAAGQSIRVMTVHAAKGLEAKIVILPDTCQTPSDRFDPKLFTIEAPGLGRFLAWSPKKDLDCRVVSSARQLVREARMSEYRRLLYVAMTRAEERLYIMGSYNAREPTADCWHRMIFRSLSERMVATPAYWNPDETIWRLQTAGSDARLNLHSANASTPDEQGIPAWLTSPVKANLSAKRPLPPSRSTEVVDTMATGAMAFGSALHTLLEILPALAADQRSASAESILVTNFPMLDESTRRILFRQVAAIVDHASLAPLFSKAALAEAPISGTIDSGSGQFIEVSGRIDRLVELDAEILFADFKTGAFDKAVGSPIDYVRQIALYASALREAYSPKPIRGLLVYASGPVIVEFTDQQLADALATAAR